MSTGVPRARKAGGDVPSDEYARVAADMSNAEGEVERYETLLREAAGRRKSPPEGEAPNAPPADAPPATPPE